MAYPSFSLSYLITEAFVKVFYKSKKEEAFKKMPDISDDQFSAHFSGFPEAEIVEGRNWVSMLLQIPAIKIDANQSLQSLSELATVPDPSGDVVAHINAQVRELSQTFSKDQQEFSGLSKVRDLVYLYLRDVPPLPNDSPDE